MDLSNKEIIFIKSEPAVEDDTTNITEVNIGNEICSIKTEQDNGLNTFNGDRKIEIEIETEYKEENMSDVEESEIDKLDVSDVNMEKPKRKRKQMIKQMIPNTIEPFVIIQELDFETQTTEDQSPVMDNTKVFVCNYCTYRTNTRRNLKRHVNGIHTKDRAYKCTYCDYAAYQRTQLILHVNAKHTKSNVYMCSHCDYKTYRKGDLSLHMNCKHTKLTLHKCTYCNYKTPRINNLTCHINTVHTKSTSYNCTYCKYKTYVRSNLGKHLNTQHNTSIKQELDAQSHK